MKLPRASNANVGFTLIEVIFVMALVMSVATFGFVIGIDSINRSNVIQERDLLVSMLLTGARARALANIDQEHQGIRITPDEFVLFEGGAYDPTDPENRSTPRNENVSVTDEGGSDEFDVVFEQLSANVIEGDGTITLSQGEEEYSVSVNTFGRIDW